MSLPSLITLRVAAGLATLSATAVVVQLASRERTPPVRCPDGMALSGARCCGAGQTLSAGRCEGTPLSCGPEMRAVRDEEGGMACVIAPKRFAIQGGALAANAADWHGAEPNRAVVVRPFVMDRAEVTVSRYAECVTAGACEPLRGNSEPGMPVSGIAPRDAEAFCRFAGGRLPSSAEWKMAASGAEGRRFPWGYTGLVCRRAAFGLVEGPCSEAGAGPDLAGTRPAGATPDGLLDLSGNVAEWTRDPDGRYRARGGSFRSRVAAELVTAAVESVRHDAPHVGFRCAY